MTPLDPVELGRRLVAFRSESAASNRAVCEYISSVMSDLGLETEVVSYDDNAGETKLSLVGKAPAAQQAGGLAYFCHTDTVPGTPWLDTGNDAFHPVERDGRLYGRGACDMKGSLATMLAATSRLDLADLSHPLYIVCTADEEVGYGGARAVSQRSRLYAEVAADPTIHCIVGEPTLLEVVYAHKGGASFRVVARGESAHTSTAEGSNAMWKLVPFLSALDELLRETENDPRWRDDEFDPPLVNFAISVTDDQPAINVKAAYAECRGAFRPSPKTDSAALLSRAEDAADAAGLDYELTAAFEGVHVDPASAFVKEMLELTGMKAARTVSYGTDASALEGLTQVVVCGPGSIDQAHKHDEWIALEQLAAGTDLYERCARRWCARSG